MAKAAAIQISSFVINADTLQLGRENTIVSQESQRNSEAIDDLRQGYGELDGRMKELEDVQEDETQHALRKMVTMENNIQNLTCKMENMTKGMKRLEIAHRSLKRQFKSQKSKNVKNNWTTKNANNGDRLSFPRSREIGETIEVSENGRMEEVDQTTINSKQIRLLIENWDVNQDEKTNIVVDEKISLMEVCGVMRNLVGRDLHICCIFRKLRGPIYPKDFNQWRPISYYHITNDDVILFKCKTYNND